MKRWNKCQTQLPNRSLLPAFWEGNKTKYSTQNEKCHKRPDHLEDQGKHLGGSDVQDKDPGAEEDLDHWRNKEGNCGKAKEKNGKQTLQSGLESDPGILAGCWSRGLELYSKHKGKLSKGHLL